MSVITLDTGIKILATPEARDVEGNIHLDRLSDVTVTSPLDNQILKYNSSTGQWTNVTAGDIVDLALTELTDVTIVSVADGQFIRYNNATGEWENSDTVDGGTF